MKTTNIVLSAYREAAKHFLPRAPRGAFLWSPPDGDRHVVAYGRVGPEASASALSQVAAVRTGLEGCHLPVADFGMFPDKAGGQIWLLVAAATATYPGHAADRSRAATGQNPYMADALDGLAERALYQVTSLVWEAWAFPGGRDRGPADDAGEEPLDDGGYGPPPPISPAQAAILIARRRAEWWRLRMARKEMDPGRSDGLTDGMDGAGGRF